MDMDGRKPETRGAQGSCGADERAAHLELGD